MSSIAVSGWDYYFKYWTHVDLHLYMWGAAWPRLRLCPLSLTFPQSSPHDDQS